MLNDITTPGKYETVAAPSLESTRELLEYWRSKCPPGRLPNRQDIVASDIPRLLPNIMILEPIDGGADWIVRLVGTAIAERDGRDATGKRIREFFRPDVAETSVADYRHCAESRLPSFARGDFAALRKEHIRWESVGLPIFGRDGTSVWLLIGLFFFN